MPAPGWFLSRLGGSFFAVIPGLHRRACELAVLVRRRDAVVKPFDRAPLYLGIQLFLDGADHDRIFVCYQGKGVTAACGASGSPDTMDIGFSCIRDVVVHNMGYL